MKANTSPKLAAALLAGFIAMPAFAQDQTAGPIEEVLVTATKRVQTLQEVPVAVSVPQGDTSCVTRQV